MHSIDAAAKDDGTSGSPSATFPQKLFSMLQLNIDQGEIIHWLPHGLAFKVVDNEKFSEGVLPKYFKHTKLTSFQRQLNLYGFRRITKGDDHGAYFHPNFQRGRKDLVANIRRLPVKANNSTSADSQSAENEVPSSGCSSYDTSFTDLDLLDDFDQPPKKKTSVPSNTKESSSESNYLFPSFLKSDKSQISRPDFTTESATPQSVPATFSQRIMGTEAIPLMSKLSMNIGYARHLAANSALNLIKDSQSTSQPHPGGGQAVLESAHYTSFNLLSKSQTATQASAISAPINSEAVTSSQQSYYDGVREARQLPACLQDYPPQSMQLNSMYACGKNSSSISDFKALINQTSPAEYSNGNDGGIWQPRLKNSASTSNSSIAGSYSSYDGIDLDGYDYDDIPSFDEAMDMMASRL